MGFKVKVSKLAQVASLPRQVRWSAWLKFKGFTTKGTKVYEGKANRSSGFLILRDETIRHFLLIFASCTNFTKFTNWC